MSKDAATPRVFFVRHGMTQFSRPEVPQDLLEVNAVLQAKRNGPKAVNTPARPSFHFYQEVKMLSAAQHV
jgi:hypothetical protein